MLAIITMLNQDPLLAYSVAAALVLLTAAFAAGINRLDFIAVFHPHGLLAVVSAVLTSLVLMVFIAWLEQSTAQLPWLWLEALPESSFPLVGAWRLPLYIVALAYGPSAGLASGALITAFSASTGLPSWPEGLLTFELVIVGWLAIAPNPRNHPWAGTFNILLAHLLTLITMGLALLRWQQRPLTLLAMWQLSGEISGGVLLSALIAAYITPIFYARVFARSHIATRPEHTPRMPLPPLTAASSPTPAANIPTKDPELPTTAATRASTPIAPTPANEATPTLNAKHDAKHDAKRDTKHENKPISSDRIRSTKYPNERILSMPTFLHSDEPAFDTNKSTHFDTDTHFDTNSNNIDDLNTDDLDDLDTLEVNQ